MTRPSRKQTRRGVVAVAVTGLLAAGLSAATSGPTASAAPCFTPADISSLQAGDAVTGKTVTKGTTPGTFTGTIEGVLENGIAPGVDMVLADLSSTTLEKVGGIWEGMSGSPVYDADGDLIGAVSYGLGTGPSTIAGITPAADMEKLLDDANNADRRSATQMARRVALPRALAHRVAARTSATSAQAAQGMHQLRLPIGVSGLSTSRLHKVAPVLHLGGGTMLDAPAAPSSDSPIAIPAGGNMAAAYSYGTVTAAGLGTATAVCSDGKILGFGHPMDFTGTTSMSLHGADTVLIQDDPTVAGFKVANLGAPSGTVDQDRMAGIRGVTGALPPVADVSTTSYVGSRQATGTTHVTSQSLLTDLALTHIIAVQDKALDRAGPGGGWASWTITGTRANGDPWTLSRSDRFADPEDISAAAAIEAAGDVDTILTNEDEVVKVGSIDVTSRLNDQAQTYRISKVEVRSFGRWVTGSAYRPVAVHAGYSVPLRYTLTSREAPTKTVTTSVRVPAQASEHPGWLHVTGGGLDEDSDDFFDVEGDFKKLGTTPTSPEFPKLLKALASQQQQNQIETAMRFSGTSGEARKRIAKMTNTSQVVSGEYLIPLVALR